mmetsp:Transcript_50391/g.135669  ORF Transcript_50391/g.135669 Transcript_50391/m.135669 type:complete len:189 (-) Transcript_50391:48-614(-)
MQPGINKSWRSSALPRCTRLFTQTVFRFSQSGVEAGLRHNQMPPWHRTVQTEVDQQDNKYRTPPAARSRKKASPGRCGLRFPVGWAAPSALEQLSSAKPVSSSPNVRPSSLRAARPRASSGCWSPAGAAAGTAPWLWLLRAWGGLLLARGAASPQPPGVLAALEAQGRLACSPGASGTTEGALETGSS